MRPPEWHGDSSVTWGIALVARLRQPVDPAEVQRRLDELVGRYPHLAPSTAVAHGLDLPGLASTPFTDAPVRVAASGNEILVAAHHQSVDGLGLVAVLSDLAGVAIESRAGGLGDRASRPFLRTALSRVVEAAFAPPSIIEPTSSTRLPHDVFASTDVVGSRRTGEVVGAAVDAVLVWNRDHQAERGRGGRISVAVGASRRPGADAAPTDDSAYLRLRRAERLDGKALDAALRTQPAEPAGDQLAATGVAARVAALLSQRLGSTLLVSHLGELEGDGFEAVSFYPVTGGRSGVSLGAATLGGRTTLTLRARGGEHTATGLSDLLALVRDGLG